MRVRDCAQTLHGVLITFLSHFLGGLLVALIGLEVFQVFLRYFLSGGIVWGRDVATLLMFCIAWLGAPLLWMQRGHLAVNLLPNALARAKGVEIALDLIMLFGAGVLAVITSWAMQSYAFLDLPSLGTAASVKFMPVMAGTLLLILAALLNLLTPQDP